MIHTRCKTIDEAERPFKFAFTVTPQEVIEYLLGWRDMKDFIRERAIKIYWLERYPTRHTSVPKIGMLCERLAVHIVWDGKQFVVDCEVRCGVDCG